MGKFLVVVKYLDSQLPKEGTIGKKIIEAETYDDACDIIDEIEKDIFIENGVVQEGSYQTVIMPYIEIM